MKIIIFTLFSILLITPLTANAGLICKGKGVVGFSKFDVLRFCGVPLMKDSYLTSGTHTSHRKSNKSSERASVNVIRWSEVQQWYYAIGYNKTSYTVEFQGGKVARVIKGQDSP